ncbi:hypothetical protein EVAR_48868_1 [Eumeta japonica]|uniref:Uncharacterized protein n=1 Tax=Eumeta variegata TaxID=151549 RepID=A0A4C1Y6D2_EUMVA|nr:hypothetical protein EVAR_48868_1 [Eumeta japonica]
MSATCTQYTASRSYRIDPRGSRPLLGPGWVFFILPRGHEYRADDGSTISTTSPSAGARHIGSHEGPFRKSLDVRPSPSIGSASNSKVWRTYSRGLLSLNVATDSVFTDRTNRSQTPSMFGAPGGMNEQQLVRMSTPFFMSLYTSHIFISSLVTPKMFVPLSEYITLEVPFRAIKQRTTNIIESDNKDSASSICTASIAKHRSQAALNLIREWGRRNRLTLSPAKLCSMIAVRCCDLYAAETADYKDGGGDCPGCFSSHSAGSGHISDDFDLHGGVLAPVCNAACSEKHLVKDLTTDTYTADEDLPYHQYYGPYSC